MNHSYANIIVDHTSIVPPTMHKLLQFSFQVIFVICLFNYCCDGFSIGRSGLKKTLSNRLKKNGFDYKGIFNNWKNGYQYVSSVFNSGATDKAKNGPVKSRLNHFSNCDDCFLGMQVSRREAYVVSNWLIIGINSKNRNYFP